VIPLFGKKGIYRDVQIFKRKGRVETLPCSDPTKQSHEIPARHSVFSPGWKNEKYRCIGRTNKAFCKGLRFIYRSGL